MRQDKGKAAQASRPGIGQGLPQGQGCYQGMCQGHDELVQGLSLLPSVSQSGAHLAVEHEPQ